MKKSVCFCFAVVVLVLLTSCFGASADIIINANGSGKIALEYRVSQMLEEIGRLDGNENWPAIPVGKTDFQRTATRIPGLSLSSYSSKEVARPSGGKDLVTKAVLKFKTTDALLAFLNGNIAAGTGAASSGTHATLSQKDGKNVLRLVLLDSLDDIDGDLRSLLQQVSAGYEIRFNFTLPKDATISVIPSSVQPAHIVSSGKKVSIAIPTSDLLSPPTEEGMAVEVMW